jgi:hypothetical protein
MDLEFLAGAVFLLYSSLFMIFVAAAGYFVARCVFEIHACQIQSAAASDGSRSGQSQGREKDPDWDEREEA